MKNKNSFLLFFTLTILSFCVASSYKFSFELPIIENPALSNMSPCVVVRIVNGGTIVIEANDQEVEIKLAGVSPAKEYSKETAVFMGNLLKGENVYIVDEPNQKYIYRAPDGLFVNAEILRQGYGRVDDTVLFKYSEEFKQIQEFAKERKKGIWNTTDTSQPAQALPVAAPPSPENKDITVYVTKAGKKYHLETCSYLSKSSVPIKLKDAKTRGYSPCSKCNPP